MADIYLNDAGFRSETDQLMEQVQELELPDLCSTTDGTIASLQFIPAIYTEFKSLVDTYIKIVKRDIGTLSDIFLAFYVYDNAYANISGTENWYPDVERYLTVDTAVFDCPEVCHENQDWILKNGDLDAIVSEVLDRLASVMEKVVQLQNAISSFVGTQNWTGESATATLSYFYRIHIVSALGLYSCADVISAQLSAFWLQYTSNPMFDPFSIDGNQSIFCKYELDYLLTCLNEKKQWTTDLLPTLPPRTEQAYIESNYRDDYSSCLPDSNAMLNGFDEPMSKIQNALDTIESNEAYLAGVGQEAITDAMENFLEYLRSVIENARRYNYTFPPDTADDPIDCSSYCTEFNYTIAYNSATYQEELSEAYTQAASINNEIALDHRRTELAETIAGNTVAIVLAIGSLVITCGADAPVAFTVIAVSSESIYLCTHTSNQLEYYQQYYQVCNGQLDGESINLLRDYGMPVLVPLYPEDGAVVFDGAVELPTRDELYNDLVWANDQVSSVVTPVANYGGELSYGEAFTASSTRWVVRSSVNGVVSYYCPNGSGLITTIVMIPGNAGVNAWNQMPVDIPGSVANQIGVPNSQTNSGIPFEAAAGVARNASGIQSNTLSDPYLQEGQDNTRRTLPYAPEQYI